ncbi:MAG: hypothetical protein NVS4B7_14140 [Ktedonobacteraceae bacterium]
MIKTPYPYSNRVNDILDTELEALYCEVPRCYYIACTSMAYILFSVLAELV